MRKKQKEGRWRRRGKLRRSSGVISVIRSMCSETWLCAGKQTHLLCEACVGRAAGHTSGQSVRVGLRGWADSTLCVWISAVSLISAAAPTVWNSSGCAQSRACASLRAHVCDLQLSTPYLAVMLYGCVLRLEAANESLFSPNCGKSPWSVGKIALLCPVYADTKPNRCWQRSAGKTMWNVRCQIPLKILSASL